jgi:hypothetical protein
MNHVEGLLGKRFFLPCQYVLKAGLYSRRKRDSKMNGNNWGLKTLPRLINY